MSDMKVKHYTKYICQFCGKDFDNEKECKEHEAHEMGLSMEEYKTLEQLEYNEKRAYMTLSGTNNDSTREKADFATQSVIEFRKEHHLEESGNLLHC
jgi:hypothetical protein